MPEQAKRSFSAPKGTRDMYPAELLRRRYIEKLWRDTAIRHGFEEIDGPAFEHTELYTAKSGEGIVSEIFGVFSGKDEAEVAALRAGGQAPFALRPEFTPTLARMYAARAAQLPKPTKWFWQQNCYRAERPQRGRLREFGQWNCDVMGDGSPSGDADTIATCVGCMDSMGLTSSDVSVRCGHRPTVYAFFRGYEVPESEQPNALDLLDRRPKLSLAAFTDEIARLQLSINAQNAIEALVSIKGGDAENIDGQLLEVGESSTSELRDVLALMRSDGTMPWCSVDLPIVRGLAYYTGVVFEIHETGGKERAVAGGGRYDNLIETFGGPPTPAVGFGMGDVVLGNILQDRGLMPEGRDLLAALSSPSASFRPDVFVIANENEDSQAALRPLVARLRRGVESESWLAKDGRKPWDPDRYTAKPLHARHSYKATKNIGKLLQEASSQHARFAAILENAAEITLRNLDTRQESKIRTDQLAQLVGG